MFQDTKEFCEYSFESLKKYRSKPLLIGGALITQRMLIHSRLKNIQKELEQTFSNILIDVDAMTLPLTRRVHLCIFHDEYKNLSEVFIFVQVWTKKKRLVEIVCKDMDQLKNEVQKLKLFYRQLKQTRRSSDKTRKRTVSCGEFSREMVKIQKKEKRKSLQIDLY